MEDNQKRIDPQPINAEDELKIFGPFVQELAFGCLLLTSTAPHDLKSFVLVEANAASSKVLKADLSTIIGNPIFQSLPELVESEILRVCSDARSTGSIKSLRALEDRQDKKGGGKYHLWAIPVASTGIMVIFDRISNTAEGKTRQLDELFQALAVEIRRRLESEERLNRSLTELKQTKTLSESAARTKIRFLANISHEIRTPLNAIIGFAHLISLTPLHPKQQGYFAKIVSSSKALLAVVNNILDLSSIETREIKLVEEDFDLEEVFQKLADGNLFLAETKGLELIMGIDSHIPTKLIGDRVRLGQVLSNLCNNAIKFTDSGEVSIKATLLESSNGKAKIQFEVSDTGIGMQPKFALNLFEQFGQEDDSATRRFAGSGLGISIVKGLVDLLGGEIWVRSQVGRGSQFFISLWFTKQVSQRQIEPSLDLRNLKVLVADDNDSSRHVLEDALRSFSFDVSTSSSGTEALDLLEKGKIQKPEVILLDWKMPGMDGLQAAKKIRAIPGISQTPIIIMCNDLAQEEILIKKDIIGIDGVLVKPFRHSKLYDAIIQLVQNGKGSKQEKEPEGSPTTFRRQLTERVILLVEDNEINQEVAVELLRGYGFEVHIAKNGKEAVQKVFDSGVPSRYDLVLMDLQMPLMDGFEATQRIRKEHVYDSLPIIAMTADVVRGFREKCLEIGMADYITKPIDPDKMIDIISRWLKSEGPSPVESEEKELPMKANFDKLKHIDAEDGLKRVAGNTRLYLKLLNKFLLANQGYVPRLRNKIEFGDEECRRDVHSLKGAAGNLGMIRLYQACAELEGMLIEKNLEQLDDALKALEDQLDLVLQELQNSLQGQPEDAKPRVTLDEVQVEIEQLVEMLRNQDAEAVDQYEKIGTLEGYEQEFEQVGKAIKGYDYDTALNILRDISK